MKRKNSFFHLVLVLIFIIFSVVIPLWLIHGQQAGYQPPAEKSNSAYGQFEELRLTGQTMPKVFSSQSKPKIIVKSKLPLELFKSRLQIVDSQNQPANLSFQVEEQGEDKIIFFNQENGFKPGFYRLIINDDNSARNLTQDFSWGVLAINTDKSSYSPGEKVAVYMTVLDDRGKTACDAEVNLTVITPNGNKYILTTNNNTILRSKECQPKNFTYTPDFQTSFLLGEGIGNYRLTLESKINGELRQIEDYFTVYALTNQPPFIISRQGPIRLYPPSTYQMTINILAQKDFQGFIEEKVPANFTISQTQADIQTQDNLQILSWNLEIKKGEVKTLSYQFKAPNISPEFYLLGPIRLIGPIGQIGFEEPRAWQLAADADPKMILFWDTNGATIPTGWTEVATTSYIRGEATYGGTGGNANHTHTATVTVAGGSTSGASDAGGSGGISIATHTHTVASSSVGAALNEPSYRTLRLISNDSGIPSTVQINTIGIFDATVIATNWARYTSQDTYYIRGNSTAGSLGGSNTHTHSLTFAFNTHAGTTKITNAAPRTISCGAGHSHSGSSLNSTSATSEPAKIDVILGQNSAITNPAWNMLAMFDNTPPSPWSVVSASGGDFYQRFMVGQASYGNTTSVSTHSHANSTVSSSQPSPACDAEGWSTGATAGQYHTHNTTFAFTDQPKDHTPPYLNVIIAKLLAYAPANCYVVESLTNDNLTVNWTDQTFGEDQFDVYRSINAGDYESLDTTAADATSYFDDTTTSGNTYAYQIRATQGATSTDWCTTPTYDTLKGSVNLENLRLENIKINFHRLFKIFLAVVNKLFRFAYASSP